MISQQYEVQSPSQRYQGEADNEENPELFNRKSISTPETPNPTNRKRKSQENLPTKLLHNSQLQVSTTVALTF